MTISSRIEELKKEVGELMKHITDIEEKITEEKKAHILRYKEQTLKASNYVKNQYIVKEVAFPHTNIPDIFPSITSEKIQEIMLKKLNIRP